MGLFRATVSRVRDLTQDVRELELTLREPNEIIFKAGQFVSFDVPKEGYPYPVTRPYSIASPPSISDRVLLLFNLVPGGLGRRTSSTFGKAIQSVLRGRVVLFTRRSDQATPLGGNRNGNCPLSVHAIDAARTE